MNIQRMNLKSMIRSVAIFPIILVSCIAVAIVGMLIYVVGKVVSNKGLLPPPSELAAYECKGFATPFTLDFGHGKDVIRLHNRSATLNGFILNGKIAWNEQAGAAQPLGFTPPTELVYDDLKRLRLLDASGVEQSCLR